MSSKNNTSTDKLAYFNLDMVDAYGEKVDKTYNADSQEARWFYDTREKLYYLVTLLSKKINQEFEVVYREKPNGQRGRGLIGFKNYILAGFAPAGNHIGENLFIKVAFSNLKKAPVFEVNLDLNFKSGISQFHDKREEIFESDYSSWPIDENFPTNWDTLVDLIAPKISNLLASYKTLLKTLETRTENQISEKSKHPLNKILYGPPGTGKTYKTKELALNIIVPNFAKNPELSTIEQRIQINFQRSLLSFIYFISLSSIK